jgi:hypothetical protein
MHQNLHTQQQSDLAPTSLWIVGGIAGLAFVTALHFFPFITLTALAAVLIPVRVIAWLRR